jgi:hypothetical protein
MERWKAIEGTNGMIEVSTEGRVRSLLRGTPRILKTQSDSKGYQRVRVTICRTKMTFKVHREVAKAFIPNVNNLPQVNHMDCDKSNNNVENLEWCTNQENVIHFFESEEGEVKSVKDIDCSIHRIGGVYRKTRTPKVKANTPKMRTSEVVIPRKKRPEWNNPNPKKAIIGHYNGETRLFESISEAERFLNSRHISDVLKGKRTHVKGWTFEYRGEGEQWK